MGVKEDATGQNSLRVDEIDGGIEIRVKSDAWGREFRSGHNFQ